MQMRREFEETKEGIFEPAERESNSLFAGPKQLVGALDEHSSQRHELESALDALSVAKYEIFDELAMLRSRLQIEEPSRAVADHDPVLDGPEEEETAMPDPEQLRGASPTNISTPLPRSLIEKALL